MTIINTNVNALVGLNNLRLTNLGLSKTLERLSSGLRINVGSDDPSGLAIAKGMEAQIGGIRVAVQNAEDGISMIHTADGALAESHDILLRMRDLTLRASNEAVLTSSDQKLLSDEFVSLKGELARKAQAVSFNGKRLFWGSNRSEAVGTYRYVASWNTFKTSFRVGTSNRVIGCSYYHGFGANSGGMLLQVGADNGQFYNLTILIGSMTLTGLGLTHRRYSGAAVGYTGGVYSVRTCNAGPMTIWFGGFANNLRLVSAGVGGTSNRMVDFNDSNMSTRQNASLALKWLDKVDAAIDKVSDARAALGIQERRILHIIDDLTSEDINVSAAKSRIYDADMAAEISEFTRLQILQQSGTAILAQANAQPQSILQLLR